MVFTEGAKTKREESQEELVHNLWLPNADEAETFSARNRSTLSSRNWHKQYNFNVLKSIFSHSRNPNLRFHP